MKMLVQRLIKTIKVSKEGFLITALEDIQKELLNLINKAKHAPNAAQPSPAIAQTREVLRALVHASFKKIFNSRAVSKQLEPQK